MRPLFQKWSISETINMHYYQAATPRQTTRIYTNTQHHHCPKPTHICRDHQSSNPLSPPFSATTGSGRLGQTGGRVEMGSETARVGVFFFFWRWGCVRVNCPSGGYQWTGQPSLLVSLVLNWQPSSDRLAASQEESMAQDTIKIITLLKFGCMYVVENVWICKKQD